MSELLTQFGQDGNRLADRLGLDGHPVQHLETGDDFARLVHIDRAGDAFRVDDVGQFGASSEL